MIKIGVSSCFMYPDVNRVVFIKKHLCYLERDMARYLSRENVLPVLIPDLEEQALQKFLAQMDGFVFQGGNDIAPETYGEKPVDRWIGDAYRDHYELKIMDYAIKHDKPVLGICRGAQLLNVYFGGSLYQDIQMQKPDAIQHRDAEAYDQLHHDIVFTEGRLLDQWYQHETVRKVNSVHHQGVKQLGDHLEVLATCPADGIIEAFLWKDAEEGKVMGVQWHPEFFYNSETRLIDAHIIYTRFLDFCNPPVKTFVND